MRLAAEEIAITIGGTSIELVPSLRAATRLARRYAGFTPIMEGVLAGNISIMADLIREGATTNTDLPDLLDEIGLRGLGATLDQLTAPLAQFVLALVGHDPDQPPADTKPGKPMPLGDYHRQLFGIATGWLGWTPDAAWSATPAEILTAYEARCDLLRAIFGSAEPTPPPPNPELDRAGLDRLRALSKGFA